jgi:hypothetical protein
MHSGMLGGRSMSHGLSEAATEDVGLRLNLNRLRAESGSKGGLRNDPSDDVLCGQTAAAGGGGAAKKMS